MGRDRLNIDELFKFYYRPLCLYATHYVQDVEMAKDIVQDCFSSLWEKMNNEKSCEVSNMKAYLYVMVKNRSLDYLSQENLFKSGVSFTELEETLLDEEVEERSVMEARMWTAIDALPERCREVFLLHKRDGLKYQEIAEKFHISVHTVDSHIQKAFRLIRGGHIKCICFSLTKIQCFHVVIFGVSIVTGLNV